MQVAAEILPKLKPNPRWAGAAAFPAPERVVRAIWRRVRFGDSEEDKRTPRRWRVAQRPRISRSVLECASPLALLASAAPQSPAGMGDFICALSFGLCAINSGRV
jgi:hypothetical protein